MRYLLLVFIVFFISCSETKDISHLQIFKYNEISGINSLDPAFAKDLASVWATSQLFNGLVQLDSNLIVQPSIAKSWTISSDKLEYEFLLKDNVFFHNSEKSNLNVGRKVSAYDFEYSFSRLLDDNIASPGRWVMSNVKGFDAINDSLFLIKLKSPFPAFLGLLTMQYCSVVPKEIVEATDFHSNPIGTGPFKFQLWQKGEKLIFRKNTNYFESHNGEKLPFLDGISISFLRDKQAAFLQFILGNLDFLSGIDASYKDEILTKDGSLNEKYINKINLSKQNYLNTEYLGFYSKDTLSPIKNLKIRQAINYGFDREKMLKFLRNNIGSPAVNGFIPKGMPSFNENVIGFNYDNEKSKQLISEVKEMNNGILDHVVLSTNASYLDLCEYIQNELGKNGLEIEINVNPPSTHRQMVATSKLSFFRASWIADYPDGENYLSLFYSKNLAPDGPNYTHFSNDEYDRMYENSLRETNPEKSKLLYQKMDSIITSKSIIVPLFYDEVVRFISKNVVGMEINATNLLDLRNVRKVD